MGTQTRILVPLTDIIKFLHPVKFKNKERIEMNLQSIIKNRSFITLVIVATLFYLFQTSDSAATHGGREREADGAYSPRDNKHGDGDGHNSNFDHEAILGSHKEAEEFEHLSPDVAKERLRTLATKMDRNMDGKLIKKSFRHGSFVH